MTLTYSHMYNIMLDYTYRYYSQFLLQKFHVYYPAVLDFTRSGSIIEGEKQKLQWWTFFLRRSSVIYFKARSFYPNHHSKLTECTAEVRIVADSRVKVNILKNYPTLDFKIPNCVNRILLFATTTTLLAIKKIVFFRFPVVLLSIRTATNITNK